MILTSHWFKFWKQITLNSTTLADLQHMLTCVWHRPEPILDGADEDDCDDNDDHYERDKEDDTTNVLKIKVNRTIHILIIYIYTDHCLIFGLSFSIFLMVLPINHQKNNPKDWGLPMSTRSPVPIIACFAAFPPFTILKSLGLGLKPRNIHRNIHLMHHFQVLSRKKNIWIRSGIWLVAYVVQ
jgi:hypothetical protein